MKRKLRSVLAVLLAALLLSVTAVSALAVSDEQTWHIVLDSRSKNLEIVPLDGYELYVRTGGEFKFYIKATDEPEEKDDGTMETQEEADERARKEFSNKHVIVELDYEMIDPDVHGIYTVSDITEDHTISAYFQMDKQASNLFSSLMILLHNIFAWFKSLFSIGG